jgi:Asp/Glu/Hydantoin racemase
VEEGVIVPTLALLHTAPGHIAAFDALLAAEPAVLARHTVQADLLARARVEGLTPPIRALVLDAVRRASVGAGAVLCTCSTIGGLAEEAGRALGVPVIRVDRPLAARAVAGGPRILVVVALASTLAPTQALLAEEAQRVNRVIAPRALFVAEAWAHFEAGDLHGYHATIAAAVRANLSDADVVVLAQASMAGAAELMQELSVPVPAAPLTRSTLPVPPRDRAPGC